MKPKCHYCGKCAFCDHHIDYENDETVPVCQSCHCRITSQMAGARGVRGMYLCICCGRHYTSNHTKLCFYCTKQDVALLDWFGLSYKDKTKPIYRYNYHWLKTEWLK